MRRLRISTRSVLGVTLILALAAAAGLPAFAAEPIRKGADLWISVAGQAKTTFAQDPIPAGFFCAASQPFTGAIAFKGAPLATEPAGVLGGVDTVVRRLDDAVFNAKGEATTRIQLMALSLVTTKPVETSCGKYDVAVHLAGEQPTTSMRIFSSEALGGTYSAPLALRVRMTFTPAFGAKGAKGDKTARRELTRRIDLGPAPESVWVYVNKPQYPAGVKIDTRGDGRPDTLLPAPSNFLAGVGPAILRGEPSRPQLAQTWPSDPGAMPTCPTGYCPHASCHCALGTDGNPDMSDPYRSSTGCAQDHLHCLWVCVDACTAPPGACAVPVACATQAP